MKSLTIGFLVLLVTMTITSCGNESGDPTPTPVNPAKTSLELVKAELKGTWMFKSLTASKAGKTATTSTCERQELKDANFPDTNWESTTPEMDYTYTTDNFVTFKNKCFSATAELTVTVTDNGDGTVKIKFSNGDTFNVNPSDITTTTIKASLINTLDYDVKYTFNK